MPSRASAIARRAASALVIRRAVAPALLHGTMDSDAWGRAAASDDAAWRLFLRVERCAQPLQRVLVRQPGVVGTDAPFRAIVDSAAQREGARILVARSNLRAAATVAADLGLRIAVLKGGVLVVGEDAVDLGDVDLLMSRPHAEQLARALQDQGWQRIEESSEEVDLVLASQDMRMEVHHGIKRDAPGLDADIWTQHEPLEDLPPLRRLGAVTHLRHVVHHVAIRHPNRRARLRDLVLIADAARRCSESEQASAFPAGETSYATQVSRSTLDAAVGVGTNGLRPEDEWYALMGYVLELRRPLPFLSREINEFVKWWSVSMLQTPWERRQVWAAARAHSLGPSSRSYIRAVERRYAHLGRAWRVAARTAFRAATWVLARPAAARVRHTVELALKSPTLSRP